MMFTSAVASRHTAPLMPSSGTRNHAVVMRCSFLAFVYHAQSRRSRARPLSVCLSSRRNRDFALMTDEGTVGSPKRIVSGQDLFSLRSFQNGVKSFGSGRVTGLDWCLPVFFCA